MSEPPPTESFFDKIKNALTSFHNSDIGKTIELGGVTGTVFFLLRKVFK